MNNIGNYLLSDTYKLCTSYEIYFKTFPSEYNLVNLFPYFSYSPHLNNFLDWHWVLENQKEYGEVS